MVGLLGKVVGLLVCDGAEELDEEVVGGGILTWSKSSTIATMLKESSATAKPNTAQVIVFLAFV